MRRDGFSVHVVMASVAMVALLSSVFMPMSVVQAERSLHQLTVQRMQAILTGMIGSDVLASHGYYGDMGVLPPDIASLIVQGAQPAFALDTNGIRVGWNGPYVRHLDLNSALSEDLWGMAFSYDGVTAQLTSSGADQQLGTADDIILQAPLKAASGDLKVSMLGVLATGPPVPLDPNDVLQVQVSYSKNGAPATQDLSWDGSDFVLSGIHRGVHAVAVTGTGAYAGTSSTMVLAVQPGPNRLTLTLEKPAGGSESDSERESDGIESVLMPMSVSQAERSRHQLTVQRMQAILTGMIGSDVLASHGYFGDMGVLPPDIASLIVQGAQPAFALDTNGIRVGWNGPYVRHLDPNSALSEDLWGMPFSYDGVTAQLTSFGADRQLGTADDIILPATLELASGDLQVSMLGILATGPPVPLDPNDVLQVQVSYSKNGDPATQDLSWDGSDFVASGIHRGVHAVAVNGTGAYAGTSSTMVLVVQAGPNRLILALEKPAGGSESEIDFGSDSESESDSFERDDDDY